MRHGKAGFKLGRVTSHRWALFRNLLVDVTYGIINPRIRHTR